LQKKEQQRLEQGLEKLGLDLSLQTIEALIAYLGLISKWNKAYNLTAIRNPADMLELHLLDSLSILPLVFSQQVEFSAKRLIDVGTGAGLPGVVLAIVNPSCSVSLLDTNGKKCRFLHQVKIELGLKNIEVIHERVEKYQPQQPFDVVFSRAFATLKDMTDNAHHLLHNEGRFLAMKGRYPQQEIDELRAAFQLVNVHTLHVPGLDAERHLVEIIKA